MCASNTQTQGLQNLQPNFNMKYRINLKTTRKTSNFSNILQQVKVLLITSMFKKHFHLHAAN